MHVTAASKWPGGATAAEQDLAGKRSVAAVRVAVYAKQFTVSDSQPTTMKALHHASLIFLFLAFRLNLTIGQQQERPNIVFIAADDLGWNDIGWHNPSIKTPVLDSLAHGGVILNHSYIQYVCSPSRTAFMTGYYPYHTGQQHSVIKPLQGSGVPLRYTFLPEKLKQLGYANHVVGKWHLGICNWLYTPTWRGFDSHHGYLLGGEDYYTHRRAYKLNPHEENYNTTLQEEASRGLDFHSDTNNILDKNGTYSAVAFSEYAVNIVKNHDSSKPLYLYLPFQSVHTPLEVPKRFEDMYKDIHNEPRRKLCGMVSALDEAVGNVTRALKEKGIFNNTLIVFTADNGGTIHGAGNNWPLRGGKYTLWEGGTRGAAFVYGVGLKRTGYTYNGLIHAVDWHPTLLGAAGAGKDLFDDKMDGINQWDTIREGSASKRTEFVYNIDEIEPSGAAIRVGEFKLTKGYTGPYNGWYPPPRKPHLQPVMEAGDSAHHSIPQLPCMLTSVYPEEDCMTDSWRPNEDRDLTITPVYLYNLTADPTEHVNLAQSLPAIRDRLLARLADYWKSLQPADTPRESPWGDPKYSPDGDSWTPGWC